jgi:hypothetical protein
MELLLVHDALHGRTEGDGTMDLGVFENLVCGYLDRRGLFVFDWRRSHVDLCHSLIINNIRVGVLFWGDL